MTREEAQFVLELTDYKDYNITDVYQDSFRAIRQNEWMLSELNVEVLSSYITGENVYKHINIVVHVLKRFK